MLSMDRRILILLGSFLALSIAVAAGWLVPIDTAAINAMAAIRSDVLTEVASNFTALGSAPVVAAGVLVAVLYCVASGRPRFALAMLGTPIAFLLCSLVKLVVHRPRPTEAMIVVPTTFSFPSGHAAASTALFLTLALLAAQGERRTGPRRVIIGAGLGIALMVAWSRVYLGVHYFSDVVGGMLLGAAGTVAALLVVRRADSGPEAKALSGSQ
jgi:undecaprenyl-diphosphatase